MAKSSGGMGANLYAGLTRKCPPGVDKSMSTKTSPSVDKDATRDSTAPTPKTLGGREA